MEESAGIGRSIPTRPVSEATSLRVVIGGGGTGGHVYPGIAVARELVRRRPGAVVTFVGTAHGVEARAVPDAGFEVEYIRSTGLKGRSWAGVARSAALLPLSAWDAWRVLSRRRPHLVIGVGGYSSGPTVLLAALRGIPTMVLEQNAWPGLTNRLLAPFVRAAAVSFETSRVVFGRKGFLTGNPVRPEFLEAWREPEAPSETIRLLVIGGSQGARPINDALCLAAPALATIRPKVVVTHQAGARDVERLRAAYRAAGVDARVEAFLEPMAPEMRAAQLILCRAGATTLAEIAAVGRPSILVPLASAADDHQRRNAEAIALAGGAELLPQAELSAASVTQRIAALAADLPRLAGMATAVGQFARPDAAALIVERGLRLAES